MARVGHGTSEASKIHAWAPKHACDILSDVGIEAWPNTCECGIRRHGAMLREGATRFLDPTQLVVGMALKHVQDMGLHQMTLGGVHSRTLRQCVETCDGLRPSSGINNHTCWKSCKRLGLIQG